MTQHSDVRRARLATGAALGACLALGLLAGAGAVGTAGRPFGGGATARTLQAIPPTPCGCPDVVDLLNRLTQDKAAIAEYRKQMVAIAATEAREGRTILAGDTSNMVSATGQPLTAYKAMEGFVNNQMVAVKNPKAHIAGAETDVLCKSSIVTGTATPCLYDDLINWHESVHRQSCEKTSGWPKSMRLMDLAQEEITAFEQESQFIRTQLRTLPPSCVLGWTVTFAVEVKGGAECCGDRFDQIKWSILRTYRGTVDLDWQDPATGAWKVSPVSIGAAAARHSPAATTVPVEVEIHDDWRRIVQSPGGEIGDDDQSGTSTEVRAGKGSDTLNAGTFEVAVDTTALTYNVSIPVLPTGSQRQVTVTRTEMSTTTHADGGTATSPRPAPVPKQETFRAQPIPSVKDLLQAGLIHHAASRAFTRDKGELHFDSGWQQVERPVVGWPRERDALKIRVQYWLDGLVPK